VNNGPLVLSNDQVKDNEGIATGLAGFAQGGGIWSGALFGPPTSSISLQNTNVSGNTLTGGPGATLEGGGLYTLGFPVTLDNSRIEGNAPDQCFGC
jgi:hypothetical protein